ncbi:MAG: hypothetical protein ABIG30_01605, partial [Candidatus Aenigmatarchaeota archaeon]
YVPPIDKAIPPNASTRKMIMFIGQLNEALKFSRTGNETAIGNSIQTFTDLEKINQVHGFFRRVIAELAPGANV